MIYQSVPDKMQAMDKLRIVMYPWFAMGHLTTFLHISNKFAKRGHEVHFILPKNSQSKLHSLNLDPQLINFIPIVVPHFDGLPIGTETTADVPFPMYSRLRAAMDLTKDEIGSLLKQLRPHFVFYDFTHWLPGLARGLGIKSIMYCTISPAAMGWLFRDHGDFTEAPSGFPLMNMRLSKCDAMAIHLINSTEEINYSNGMRYVDRMVAAVEESDAIVFKTCREMEAKYLDFIQKRFNKPVFMAGPVLPEQAQAQDDRWVKWLDKFEAKSVIYCAIGSEARLTINQFQELLLGIELTGYPFFVALKPPIGFESTAAALPDGFAVRTEKRGIVHGGWVPQTMILSHSSVGCFITHCGWGSLSEGILSKCRLVLMPQVGDQLINGKLFGEDLRVGVEVEKGDDGVYRKGSVKKAVDLVMYGKELGNEIIANHGAWRELLLKEGLEDSYADELVLNLQSLLKN